MAPFAVASTATLASVSQQQQEQQPPPPGLQEATKNSTLAWQRDLESLFHHAKDRFPDVVWELVGSEEEDSRMLEEVWGHKAIVYARAPPSFQNRYFTFRPNGGALSPAPYSSSPSYPIGDSALSLGLESSINLALERRSPSPSASTSLAHHNNHSSYTTTQTPGSNTTLLRLTTNINPSLFSDELEYLYTGKGFGEAFEFLFDTADSRETPRPAPGTLSADGLSPDDPESLRIDKLRKDLVFMWRSRLYSDVRIALTGNFGGSHSAQGENTTAIFSSHRFILVSRSPYFHTALIGWPLAKAVASGGGEPPTLTLPSPPFTPASLHFTLGFIYTGTLIFSHRSYDLATALSLLQSAMYLSLPTLHDEVQARIVQEMCHGLFHAFIPFAAYEALTQGRWGTGGCRCRQCARRAPRVLEFAVREDVRNTCLERGARRALVGMFGEGWCTAEFGNMMPPKLRESLLRGLAKRTTPENAFPLLFAAEHALRKIGSVIEPWADVVREMLLAGRKGVDEVLARESERCFEAEEWMEIMQSGGVRFEDGERVEWAMAAVLRGVKEPYAAALYQTLVSSILLRPHPTDVTAPMLPVTSHVHVQVEQTRVELLRWIGKHWLEVRMEKGFDVLEGWALKEISDHIEVPIDDLLSPPSYTSNKGLSPSPSSPSLSGSMTGSPSNLKRAGAHAKAGQRHGHHGHHHLRPISNHPHTSKVDAESDAASSMRVSVLSRSVAGSVSGSGSRAGAGGGVGSSSRGSVASSVRSGRERDREREEERGSMLSPSRSNASVRSSAASTHSVASFASASTISAPRQGGGSGTVTRAKRAGAGAGTGNGEKMSPAKRIASEVRAAHAGAGVGVRRTPEKDKERERERERPDSKLTPSIVEPDGVGADSDIYLTDEYAENDGDGGEGEGDEQSVLEGEDDRERESVLDQEEEDGGEGEEDEDEDDTVSFRTGTEMEQENEEGQEQEHEHEQEQEQDDTQSLASASASDVPSVYHTPRASTAPTARAQAPASSAATRSAAGVKTVISKPRSLAPSVQSSAQRSVSGSVRKTVVSGSTSSVRTSQYTSAASASRPSSRGSSYSVTSPRTPRVSTTRASPTTATFGGAGKPTSRPVSRVSTRSVSGGNGNAGAGKGKGANRPVSTASTATATETDTGSASTYRTAPASGSGSGSTAGLAVRTRRTSATSTASVRTAGGGGGRSATGSPVQMRARRVSGASVSSVASNASSVRAGAGAPGATRRTRSGAAAGAGAGGTPTKRQAQAQGVLDPSRLSPAVAVAVGVGRAKSAGAQIQTASSGPGSGSVDAKDKEKEKVMVKKLSVGAAGVGATAAARRLAHQKSGESMRRPGVGGKVKVKDKDKELELENREKEKDMVKDNVPSSPAPSVPPALPDKEKEKEKEKGAGESENGDVESVIPQPTTTTTTTEDAPLSSLPENTSSTITIKPRAKVHSDDGSVSSSSSGGTGTGTGSGNEHKKTSSSASSSSVATLRRKGSSDTIRTVKSSGLSSVVSGAPSSEKDREKEKDVDVDEGRPRSKEMQLQAKGLPTSPPLPPLPLSVDSPRPKASPLLPSSMPVSSSLTHPPSTSSLSHPPSSSSPSPSPHAHAHAHSQPQPQPQPHSPSPLHPTKKSSTLTNTTNTTASLNKPLSSIDALLASDVPTGATLEIGIPCIISSKRKRFKAYARYIGEVVGEKGEWVGVEVPVPAGGVGGSGDGWGDGSGFGIPGSGFSTHSGHGHGHGHGHGQGSGVLDKTGVVDDRQWNDGSWGGIRYFEIGGMLSGSEFDSGNPTWYSGGGTDDRAARRRRLDASSGSAMTAWGTASTGTGALRGDRDPKMQGLLKREGDQLSIASERMKRVRSVSPAVSEMSGSGAESRGLFVRPQQVLYVVDAVGADL
ncbi:hypothetical protein JR316_0009386 [Psilocybe cubensis]|uniref:Uncharacterized protein n=2 Tax=Psilocybe cubensis TaxID=181762 RepID=A0ACB8GT61_PSICU|nr:hypothetical protein JR316_0009386 [Psilocybe cubensis]KAH9478923.1 hypothetical protein JR316_0009386 [Psilocybe cubensis]